MENLGDSGEPDRIIVPYYALMRYLSLLVRSSVPMVVRS